MSIEFLTKQDREELLAMMHAMQSRIDIQDKLVSNSLNEISNAIEDIAEVQDAQTEGIVGLIKRVDALEGTPTPEPEPPTPPNPEPPTELPGSISIVGSCYLPSTPSDPANPTHRIGLSKMRSCVDGSELTICGRATAFITYSLPDALSIDRDVRLLPAATPQKWVAQNADVLSLYNEPTVRGIDRYDATHTVNVNKTYYMVDGTKGKPTIYLRSKDGTQPVFGPWHLDGWGENSVGGNVCEIPVEVRGMLGGFTHGAACAFTPGSQTNTWGPGFIGFTPDKSIPPGGSLPAKALIFYPMSKPMRLRGPSSGMVQSGGEQCGMGFVNHNGRHALVCGLLIGCGDEHYKGIHPETGTEQAGYWSDWYESRLFFYDVEDMAKVARGEMGHWQIMPYLDLNIDEHFFLQTPRWQRRHWFMSTQGSRIVIVERDVMKHLDRYEPNPAVHVFEAIR
jgi:hypothetical protein